jgi:SAM-dependent methyltransferase
MTGREDKFERYYDAVEATPPRPTLIKALELFAAEGRPAGIAADLGCGSGVDTVELLNRGWRVIAIDKSESALERLRNRPDLPVGPDLETVQGRFEDVSWGTVRLVNASFALPLAEPTRFPELWQRILASLEPGGRFSGQLYGPRDSWAKHQGMTILERPQVEGLVRGLAVEALEETERDGMTAVGRPKHWHYYELVLRKP